MTDTAYRSRWADDDTAETLRSTARRFFEKEGVPNYERWKKQQFVDRDFWRRAGELGLLCISVPEEYGGGGGSFAHDIIVLEEQARSGDLGWGNGVHSGIVAHYILGSGTQAQKRRWLPGMATGELVAAIAMTEPGAGSDLAGVRTTARRDGGCWVIDGAKTFITNGATCDLLVVVAKTDPSAGARGISLIVVETEGCAGFERGRILEKMGQHTADTSELFFDSVRVPAENLLGEENRGFGVLMQNLPQERLLIGAGAVVCAERAVELATSYVKDRQVFGGPLLNQQNARFQLAECATLARVGRVFIDDCIERHLAGGLDNVSAAMSKWWLSDMQNQVIDKCLQLFGGYGYMREYPIARMWADARPQRIYGGSNEIMKEIIARSL